MKNDQQQIEFMYEKLLNFSEKHKDDIEVPNMCRFLCELCYDLSPSGNHASHLILSAMITKMEQKIDKGH